MLSRHAALAMILLPLLCAMLAAAEGEGAPWTELVPQKATNLDAWKAPLGDWQAVSEVTLDPQDAKKLTAKPGEGAIYNGPKGKTRDITTKQEFGDLEAHIEFLISSKSNSGIYFMGRYELQVYDSFGVEKDHYPGIECGGLYPRWINNQNVEGHSPNVNASKPPGEWQTFDVLFRAPKFDAAGKKIANAVFVKVTHNGKVIHENVELNGSTRGGIAEEKASGPFRIQGDHGPIAYRNFRVRPLH